MKRIIIILLAGLCHAAEAGISVTTTQGEPGTLVVSGEWADSCVPVLDDARLESGAIVLLASRESGKACGFGQSKFQFEIAMDSLAELPLADGRYGVRLYVRDGDDRAAVLAGFDLLQVGISQSVRPESGLWWAEPGGKFATSGPGVGFAVEIQGDQSVVMLNGYGNSGRSSWLLSTGRLDGAILRGSLTELADGQTFFGPFSEPQTAFNHGQVIMEFHDTARATLWLLGEADGRFRMQPVSLVRFAFGQALPLAGRWLLVPEAGGESLALDLSELPGPSSAGWTMQDAGGAHTLSCQALAGRKSSPPESCTLTGAHTLHFSHIGLNRWHGHDLDGQAWLAFRLD